MEYQVDRGLLEWMIWIWKFVTEYLKLTISSNNLSEEQQQLMIKNKYSLNFAKICGKLNAYNSLIDKLVQ